MNIRFYAEFNIQISKRPQILGSQVGHILKICDIVYVGGESRMLVLV